MKQVVIMALTLLAFVGKGHAAQINWQTNYDEAVKQAQASSKPLLLFFTGSDWCGWCKKLDSEALETPDFAKMAGNEFVFVLVDFPSKKKLSSEETAQNKELQQRFNVKGFPTVIILDPDQKQIGVTGYRPGGGTEYANHLLKMVKDYSGYKQKVSALGALSAPELKDLLKKGQEFHCTDDLIAIVQKGAASEDAPFFLLEQVRLLEGKGEDVSDLKEQLLAQDPENKHLTHYHIAVLEFEKLSREKRPVEAQIEPLRVYLEKWGATDQENAWRLYMIISQVLSDQNDFEGALKYARSSYELAPSSLQPDIAEAIEEINSNF